MALIANRRSVMTLFSSDTCPDSHQTRFVLSEKSITVDIVNVGVDDEKPEDLLHINPYNSVPTLVDRELVLYDAPVIMEYLDERFPHPPLMPVDPVSRAKARLYTFRIGKDWYSLTGDIETGTDKQASAARKTLRDSLAASADLFAAKPFFLSDEFSLVDCYLAPLLWRLQRYEIELPKQAKAVTQYAERIFSRPSFEASLTASEKEMRS